MPRTIEVTELILRDGHQSQLATRISLEDVVPACEDIDTGFRSVECWGRRDAWRLHPLPERRSLGAAEDLRQADVELAAANVAAWAKPAGVSALRRPWWSGSWPNQRITEWTCSVCWTR